MPTRDDNALLTRCLLASFEKRDFSKEQIEKYNTLKKHEQQGMSSMVTEILRYRDTFEKYYTEEYDEEYLEIKEQMEEKKLPFDERLIRNYVSICTPLKIYIEKTDLGIPFDYEDFRNKVVERIADQSKKISSSEAVSTFWNMIVLLFESGQIKTGEDFKIQKFTQLVARDKYDNKKEISWKNPTDLLFLRLNKVHPLYLEAYRKQYGRTGIDLTSIIHYIKSHKAYVGYTESTRYDNQVTSGYIFDYKILGILLSKEAQNHNDPDPASSHTEYTPPAHKGNDDDLPF